MEADLEVVAPAGVVVAAVVLHGSIPLESHTSHFDAASASDCSTEDAWVKV